MRKKLREYYNIRCFKIPKSSKFFHNCEDSFIVDNYKDPKLIAISDGCGSTFVPDIFSSNLTSLFPKYAKDIFNRKYKAWSNTATENWKEYIETVAKKNIGFTFQFVKKVAGATFLGVQLKENGFKSKIDIVAIGDSCLFQIRGGKIIDMFPKIEKFSGVTKAIQTSSKVLKLDHREIEIHHKDTILLATDGVGEWITANPKKIDIILSIQDNDDFLNFIEKYRQSKKEWLQDDDSTLIIIDVVEKLNKKTAYFPTKKWENEYDKQKDKALETATQVIEQRKEIEFEIINTIQDREVTTTKENLTEERKGEILNLLDEYDEKKEANVWKEIIIKLPKVLLESFIEKIKTYYGSDNNIKGNSK